MTTEAIIAGQPDGLVQVLRGAPYPAAACGWSLGPRGGVRWGAGIGATEYGTVLRGSEQSWPSRRAAVGWVVANAGGAR
jgi:hypothetical protein